MYHDFPEEIERFVDGWAMIDGEEEVNRVIAAKVKRAFKDGYWSGDNNNLAHKFYNRLMRHSVAAPAYKVQIVGKTEDHDESHYFAFNDTLYLWLNREFSASIAKRVMDGERVPLLDCDNKVCVCIHK